jgi:hypothetical protein
MLTYLIHGRCEHKKTYLIMGSSELVGQPLPYRAKPVVSLITRSPQRVSTDIFRGLNDLQNCVVGGNSLESDTVVLFLAFFITIGIQGHTPHANHRLQVSSHRRNDFCTTCVAAVTPKL